MTATFAASVTSKDTGSDLTADRAQVYDPGVAGANLVVDLQQLRPNARRFGAVYSDTYQRIGVIALTSAEARNLARAILAQVGESEPFVVDQTALQSITDGLADLPRGESRLVEGLDAILGWECPSCREDVGWANTPVAYREPNGQLTYSIECGHCGGGASYDAEGNETDEY